jgi:hypothetical protein
MGVEIYFEEDQVMQKEEIKQWYGEVWEHVCSILVTELPCFSISEHALAPSSFKSVWCMQSMRVVVQYVCEVEGVKCILGKKLNLRDSGEMGWVLHVHINLGRREMIVMSEMLNCAGKGNCAVLANSKSGKEKACSKSWRWAIFAERMQLVEIWMKGLHGESFQAPMAKMQPSRATKLAILESDGLTNSRIRRLTTALHEVIRLQKRGEALGTIMPALVPTQQQTKNLLTYTQ